MFNENNSKTKYILYTYTIHFNFVVKNKGVRLFVLTKYTYINNRKQYISSWKITEFTTKYNFDRLRCFSALQGVKKKKNWVYLFGKIL